MTGEIRVHEVELGSQVFRNLEILCKVPSLLFLQTPTPFFIFSTLSILGVFKEGNCTQV